MHHLVSVTRLCACLALAPTALAAQGAPTSPADPPHVTLLRADRETSTAALRVGLVRALADKLSDDALFLYEGAPIVSGRAMALRLLESQPELRRLRLYWHPLAAIVSRDGTMGITYGRTTILEPGRSQDSVPRVASYLNVWRRGGDGGWRIVARVDIGLVSPATVVLPDEIRALPRLTSDLMAGRARDLAIADASFAKMAGESGAPSAFASFAAPEGVTFGPGGVVNIGREAIRAALASGPAARAVWRWSPVFAAGTDDGELGYTVGEATIRLGARDADVAHTKYLSVWRRQADGTFKFLIDAGNGRPAPSP